MKRKILALGLFGVCCLGMLVTPAKAYGWILSPWCRPCHRYETRITCRPYNAFTPICWGNLICDGCCPSPCGVANGCLPMMMGAPPWCSNYGPPGLPCMPPPGPPPMGMDGCCATDMPMGMPGMPMGMPGMPPAMPGPGFVPPMPTPMPLTPNTAMGYPLMPGGLAQANYYPNNYAPYYPGYYPNYPMPMPMPMQMPMSYNPNPVSPYGAAPYYWYGYGR